MPAQLKNGVQGAPGGRRKGAGRKPDWYKRALQRISSSKAALKFLKDAVDGKKIDTRVIDGREARVVPSVDTRKNVWESVHDRGFGKPVSILEMKDEDGKTLYPAVVLLPAAKELDKRD